MNENVNGVVAENIARCIESTGMKQYVIAEKADLTAQALTDVIKGRRILRIKEVQNIAKALGVEVGELFKTDEKESG